MAADDQSQRVPRVLFVSENLALGAMSLMALHRLHSRRAIKLVAVWSNQPDNHNPAYGASEHQTLLHAGSQQSDESGDAAVLDGVFVPDYPTLARELSISHHQVNDMNALAAIGALTGLELDLGICCGHSSIFNDKVLASASSGWLNMHPSMLPAHRGPLPAFWELRAGEESTGVTMTEMTRQIDGGRIVVQQAIPLEQPVAFREIVRRQSEAAGRLIEANLLPYFSGEITPQPQPEGGSYQRMPTAEDMILTPEMGCDAIHRFIIGMRDLAPAVLMHRGEAFAVEGSVAAQQNPDAEGERGMTEVESSDRIRLRCADGWITLLVRPYGEVVPQEDS